MAVELAASGVPSDYGASRYPLTHRLIGPTLTTSPADGPTSRGGTRGLPDDLLQEASVRLGIFALTGAVLWVTAPFLERFFTAAVKLDRVRWHGIYIPDLIAAVNAVVALALFAWTRRTRRPPRFILDVGLGFLIFTSLGIATLWHWDGVPRGFVTPPVFTWIGIVAIMFAALIPNPPWKTVAVSLFAVSMNPIGMLIARERGAWEFGSVGDVFGMHYPDYMLVGVAGIISHVVTRLGQQVSRARELGSYHVGELIGRGGMGEVYRATHRMLARPAAIKLIRPEMIARGDSEMARLAVTRFRREAEVAASLQSPHTVALYDFGVTSDQALYFVMELLEGMDLDKLVARHGALPPARVIHILRQVCESLAEAHARGLVHRDIKPANIHIGRFGLRHDFVKVLDFGLVKAVDARERGPGHTVQTEEGIAPGTPDFMAPEMTLGNPVDGRADIYAVGCVGYYLLTAKPVFESANVFHMIARHLNDAPASPAILAPHPVPPELEQIVLACLRKQPGDRPQDAGILARMLAAVSVEPWTEDQAAEWWRNRADVVSSPIANSQ